jgi:hypothetical protein
VVAERGGGADSDVWWITVSDGGGTPRLGVQG